jgi:2-polyprenyl-6-methoxyphenol hydroxylase-like FAD-dependent oxidoreductase
MSITTLPSNTTVLIAGGGPVGLATAVELGSREVDCVLLEPRTVVSTLRPRAKASTVRTMEHLSVGACGQAPRAGRAAGVLVPGRRRLRHTAGSGNHPVQRFIAQSADITALQAKCVRWSAREAVIMHCGPACPARFAPPEWTVTTDAGPIGSPALYEPGIRAC